MVEWYIRTKPSNQIIIATLPTKINCQPAKLGDMRHWEYTETMKTPNYETANGWLSAMHEEGHSVSIVLCQAIEKIMKAQKCSFADAYQELEDQHRITYIDGDYGLSVE